MHGLIMTVDTLLILIAASSLALGVGIARLVQAGVSGRRRKPQFRTVFRRLGRDAVRFDGVTSAADLDASIADSTGYRRAALAELKAMRSDPRMAGNGGYVIGALRRLNPYAFEELVAFCLSERGMAATVTGYSRDGGVDAWAEREGRVVVVQAKRWKRHINNRDIVAIARVAERVNGVGLFVHTGRTGRLARAKAKRHAVGVVSGDQLVSLVLGLPFWISWDLSCRKAAPKKQGGGSRVPLSET